MQTITSKTDKPGVYLGFQPQSLEEGSDNFKILLINGSGSDLIFQYSFETLEDIIREDNGKLDGDNYISLGDFNKDQLNDSPAFYIQVQPILTTGESPWFEKALKVKAKVFFQDKGNIPFTNIRGPWFELFGEIKSSEVQDSEADLKAYTLQAVMKNSPKANENKQSIPLTDVELKAHFSPEIDLHIEKLLPHFKKMSGPEIKALQLRKCKEFIEEAIRFSVSPVFIIHGEGDGILRNAVADSLRKNPQIQHFEHGYHEGYGFGATKVNL